MLKVQLALPQLFKRQRGEGRRRRKRLTLWSQIDVKSIVFVTKKADDMISTCRRGEGKGGNSLVLSTSSTEGMQKCETSEKLASLATG